MWRTASTTSWLEAYIQRNPNPMDTLYKGRKPFNIRGSLLHLQHRFLIKDLLFGLVALFAFHRRLMKTNLNGQMGRPAQWHACVHSNTLEEAGKEQVKLTPADQVTGRPGMHSSTFRASACDCSLGEGALAAYISKKTWPSPNPESYSMLPLAY